MNDPMTMARRIPEPGPRAEWLADAELRARLERFVRRRLSEDDALDVVQATIADALASDSAPDDAEGFRRFVFVIARNKVADHFRRAGRETPDEDAGEREPGDQDPISARDLLRWAEHELPSSEDQSTLEWMLREADGDKLEHIAEEAQLPAPRVRQRVSRLRRYLRTRWAAQLAAAGIAGLCVVLGYAYLKREQAQGPERITHESTERLEQARRLRGLAFERCTARDFRACLDRLDQARLLDPSGDGSPDVQQARRAAGEALRPAPAPSSAPSVEPSETPTPAPTLSAPPAPPVRQAPPVFSSEKERPPAPKQEPRNFVPKPTNLDPKSDPKGPPRVPSKGNIDSFEDIQQKK
jgi:RNA polymerase sigma factor (sigma-70 family)